MKYIIGSIVVLAALIVSLNIGQSIDQKQDTPTLVSYPEFETVVGQPYCRGVADMALSNNWDDTCSSMRLPEHCALAEGTVKLLADQHARNVEMCENR